MSRARRLLACVAIARWVRKQSGMWKALHGSRKPPRKFEAGCFTELREHHEESRGAPPTSTGRPTFTSAPVAGWWRTSAPPTAAAAAASRRSCGRAKPKSWFQLF